MALLDSIGDQAFHGGEGRRAWAVAYERVTGGNPQSGLSQGTVGQDDISYQPQGSDISQQLLEGKKGDGLSPQVQSLKGKDPPGALSGPG